MMWGDPRQQIHHMRWAVITKMGRVVVEAETAEAAREKAGRAEEGSQEGLRD